MKPRAHEIANTILQICQSTRQMSGPHIDAIVEKSGCAMHDVKLVIKDYLIPSNYIEESYPNGHYKITGLGRSHLGQATGSYSMSFGDNVNFALNSPNARQSITIDLDSLDQDIRDHIAMLDDAIKAKNGSAMKKAFGYIADKSVDAAISIMTGVLLR